jgi:hypothetical protein
MPLGRQSGINWHFIYGNNGKWDKREVTGKWLHVNKGKVTIGLKFLNKL